MLERQSRRCAYRSGPILTCPTFWAGYAKVIDLRVEESEYRGFFRAEREDNENAVGDLMEVLYEEGTTAPTVGKIPGSGEAGGAAAKMTENYSSLRI
jgi:hypothetical protein